MPTTDTFQLPLASGNGPITRTVRRAPARDASLSELPLIDVSPIFSDSLQERKAVAQEIHHAATNTGFFYIANHGVPSELVREAYAASLAFFRQDIDTKMIADTTKSLFGNGYYPRDMQSHNTDEGIDVSETFSIKSDPRLDPTISNIGAIPEAAVEYLHFEDFHWEATVNLPRFKKAMVAYYQSCLVLARALTRAFALSLGLAEHAFDSKVQHSNSNLNLNYHPPLLNLSPDSPNSRMSIGSHTDFELFTILWQDDVGGLQVLNRDGQWINARPIPDTFVINIADYLQRITNDKYVSTVHRAKNCSGRERISMPFFWGFGLHESCDVLDQCVGPDEGKKYEEIKCAEWFQKRVHSVRVEDKV